MIGAESAIPPLVASVMGFSISELLLPLFVVVCALIFSFLVSEGHSCECNEWAIHHSLKGCDLELSLVLHFDELLFGHENVGFSRCCGGISQRAGL